jgi:catechol 2,3-dioxygenase-like lactoylglutathione lyase family enzyme
MGIKGFDHITVSTADAAKKFEFYRKLGFGILFEDEMASGELDKAAFTCGDNKINFREKKGDVLKPPHLCLVWEGGIDTLIADLHEQGLTVAMGPVPRLGGLDGGLTRGISVYVRDPDGMALEFISYDPEDIVRYPGQTSEERYKSQHSAAKAPANL